MTYSEMNDKLQGLLADAAEKGRQEERRRLRALSPLTEKDLRRLIYQGADPVPELAERLGGLAEEYGAALEQLLHLVERSLPLRDLETHAAVLKSRALIGRALAVSVAVRPARPRLELVVRDVKVGGGK